ncbi:MAG: hypothetical protein HY852_25020 [Bradyrhizobium sp.]|uniref:hypothetical protein n=1 Tax=Bradyrhizobium sp. TaxID=376 RepID=UPI0025C28D4D|nr:hypothetical protein [Bradyrhizobium sp.]MBI5265070.1 hypothetical protein [Bradyrhizobium sp.]
MRWSLATWMLLLTLLAGSDALAGEQAINPRTMPAIGTVDERFQSYNVEMVEVAGGRFWKPFAPERAETAAAAQSSSEHEMYAYRPPTDLANARVRKLAAALAPAYVRVSGTWANATYFADADAPPPAPPAGFDSVLTRAQWRGVVDFARAVDARLVTSFAVSPGSRDTAGVWQPDQARRLLAYTNSLGGRIAAVEYMNEPTLAAQNGAPAGYDAAAYGRDFRIFRRFLKKASPDTLLLGPGSVGESTSRAASGLNSADLLAASGRGIDRFSYHHYGTVSPRCGGRDRPDDALSEEWLSRTDKTLAFYRALRDQFEPGKPLWLTETADAACGGNRWDATFLDTFRYLDQLGRMARAGVQVVMHNTLAASDYGLLDEKSFEPRPNYWGALLWRRLMGRTVLDAGVSPEPGLHVYAHCLRGTRGGVSVLALNTSPDAPHTLSLPTASERYTLEATHLQDKSVRLNGDTLRLGVNDQLPAFTAVPAPAGAVTLAPASIMFLTVPTAGNRACR